MRRTSSRRAIAPLELVLVLPLLLMLCAGLFLMGRAVVRKETAITTARARTWEQLPNAAPGDVLQLNHDPLASVVTGLGSERVELRGMFNGATLTAQSKGAVLGRPWDNQDIAFVQGQGPFVPHLKELGQILKNLQLAGQLSEAALASIRLGMDPDSNPVSKLAAQSGEVALLALKVGATFLKIVIKPVLQLARAAVKVMEAAARASLQFRWARYLSRVASFLQVGSDAIDTLYDATNGLPGSSGLGLLQRLLRSIP